MKKWLLILISFLFIVYLALYISQLTGYYDYTNRKKVTLTNEQIEKFEQDIKDGKNIDIGEYMESLNKNYSNNISNAGLSVSKGIENYSKKIIGGIFNVLGNLLNGEK